MRNRETTNLAVYLGWPSLICAIAGFFVLGSADNMSAVINSRCVVIGVFAVALGVVAFSAGCRKAASLGIIFGALVTLAPIAASLSDRQANEKLSQQAQKLVGQPVPSFTFQNISGANVSSTNLIGTDYVVDFWTRSETVQILAQLQHLRPGGGYSATSNALKVFAVVNEALKPKVLDSQLLKNSGVSFLFVPNKSDVGFPFASKTIPYTMVVNRKGKITAMAFEAKYGSKNRAGAGYSLGTYESDLFDAVQTMLDAAQ